jgi:hypothetical protein
MLVACALPGLRQRWLIYRAASTAVRDARGDIVLSGEVIDEDGSPLSGVLLGVTATRRINPRGDVNDPWDREKRTWEETVDGRFSLTLHDWETVTLRFAKPGYDEAFLRSQARDTKVTRRGKPGPEAGALIAEPAASDRTSLRVVLEARGRTADLVYHGAALKISKADAVHAAIVEPERTVAAGSKQWIRCKTVSVASAPALPAHCLILRPSFTPSGGLDVISVRGGDVTWDLPRRVRLAINTDGDGLIALPVAPGIDVFRGMREAPREGYVEEVEFGQADYRPGIDLETNAPQLYFFIKIGNRYGRGRLVIFSRPNIADLSVELQMQPDGTRFLGDVEGP